MFNYDALLDTLDRGIENLIYKSFFPSQERNTLERMTESFQFTEEQVGYIHEYVAEVKQSYSQERKNVRANWDNKAHLRLREWCWPLYFLTSWGVGFVGGTAISAPFATPQSAPPILVGSLVGLGTFTIGLVLDIMNSYSQGEFALTIAPELVTEIYMIPVKAPYKKQRKQIRAETLQKLKQPNEGQSPQKNVSNLLPFSPEH